MPNGKMHMFTIARLSRGLARAAALGLLIATPVAAQDIETVDPSAAVNTDGQTNIQERPGDAPVYSVPEATPPENTPDETLSVGEAFAIDGDIEPARQAQPQTADTDVAPGWVDPDGNRADTAMVGIQSDTYKEDDLIGAAEGLFGEGAEGVARMIQNLLKEQGEPNAYIVGREAGGAFILGARYGSGTLFHKVEGERPVYWTGPSVGFDAGANAGNTFILVYNLFNSEDLYKRFPAGEGQAYFVGGLSASYLRRGDKVLIPIRVGAGLRLGVNAGYLRFSKKQRWLPF